jgi:hypothetical protein
MKLATWVASSSLTTNSRIRAVLDFEIFLNKVMHDGLAQSHNGDVVSIAH